MINNDIGRTTKISELLCCQVPHCPTALRRMLILEDNMIFARGGRRICYIHPQDPNKCVKVLGVNGDPVKRRAEAPWYKKFRPLSMFNDNLRELKAFQALERHSERIWQHFPRCYGLVDTNQGLGIVTELVRNRDGQVPYTVHDFIQKRGLTPELLQALDAFFELLKTEVVITRDILDHNIVAREDGQWMTIVMIDGFGSSEILPFSTLFQGIARKKVNRKIDRFYARYLA